MKFYIKAFLNEILVIFFSLFLFFIGILYSNDQGFYSRELLSSGTDDFDIFIGITRTSIFGILFGIINLVFNIFLLNRKKKVINISNIIYYSVSILQFLGLIFINLDTSLIFVFFTFDLFSLWFLLYIIGLSIIIFSKKVIQKLDVGIECIEIKNMLKIFIMAGFIIIMLFTIKIWFH